MIIKKTKIFIINKNRIKLKKIKNKMRMIKMIMNNKILLILLMKKIQIKITKVNKKDLKKN